MEEVNNESSSASNKAIVKLNNNNNNNNDDDDFRNGVTSPSNCSILSAFDEIYTFTEFLTCQDPDKNSGLDITVSLDRIDSIIGEPTVMPDNLLPIVTTTTYTTTDEEQHQHQHQQHQQRQQQQQQQKQQQQVKQNLEADDERDSVVEKNESMTENIDPDGMKVKTENVEIKGQRDPDGKMKETEKVEGKKVVNKPKDKDDDVFIRMEDILKMKYNDVTFLSDVPDSLCTSPKVASEQVNAAVIDDVWPMSPEEKDPLMMLLDEDDDASVKAVRVPKHKHIIQPKALVTETPLQQSSKQQQQQPIIVVDTMDDNNVMLSPKLLYASPYHSGGTVSPPTRAVVDAPSSAETLRTKPITSSKHHQADGASSSYFSGFITPRVVVDARSITESVGDGRINLKKKEENEHNYHHHQQEQQQHQKQQRNQKEEEERDNNNEDEDDDDDEKTSDSADDNDSQMAVVPTQRRRITDTDTTYSVCGSHYTSLTNKCLVVVVRRPQLE